MKVLSVYFFAVFLLASCTLKDVKYTGFDGVSDVKFENKELNFTLNLRVKNENGFNIKLKPCKLDVLLIDHKIADLYLDEKIKFTKNSENTYSAKLRASLADGALFALLKIRPTKSIDLRFKGKIKVAGFGITTKKEIDETQSMDLSLLKLLKLF